LNNSARELRPIPERNFTNCRESRALSKNRTAENIDGTFVRENGAAFAQKKRKKKKKKLDKKLGK